MPTLSSPWCKSVLAFAITSLISIVAFCFVIVWVGMARGRLRAQPPAPSIPPAAMRATTADSSRGRSIYQSRCVECHGEAGRGDGPAAMFLAPRPRDFAQAKYKIRTTETGSVPTDDDLILSVRQGLYGSAMPAWDGLLTASEIQDVVEYVKAFSPRFKSETPAVAELGTQVPSSPESIVRGRQVYETLQCGKCHGSDGRGTGAAATEFQDDWQQPLSATDLTQPWTFRGGATARDISLRFRTGMSGTPMPSFKGSASDAEMWDLANYVVSLGRKPVWSMTAQEIQSQYAREGADARADPVNRGHYLVDTLGCSLCHSPVDANARVLPGLRMAGGLLIRIEPFGDYPTGNLTPDKETGLGSWTDDEIKRVVTKGILRDGTRLLPFPMDWPSYANMKPDDLSAIVAYLRTIPPVFNKVPRPTRTFLPFYLWGKFKMLILAEDPPILLYPGNAGVAAGGQR
jgi:mono/diheme cytochrome c family protein